MIKTIKINALSTVLYLMVIVSLFLISLNLFISYDSIEMNKLSKELEYKISESKKEIISLSEVKSLVNNVSSNENIVYIAIEKDPIEVSLSDR